MKDDELIGKIKDLEPTIDAIKKLQENGIISVLESLGDQADLILNYGSTMETLGTISLLFRMLGIANISIGKLNQEKLIKDAQEIDWGNCSISYLAF